MQGHVGRQLKSGQTVPESVLAEMIVIAGHKVPLSAAEGPHVFDRASERLLSHLLFFVDISGNENRGGPGFDGSLA